MRTFSSSKSIFHLIAFSIIIAFLVVMLFIVATEKSETAASIYVFYVISGIVLTGLIWVLLDTRYIIKEKMLFYYSGPFRGKIEIEKIRKIQHHTDFFVPVTLKPALDSNGLIISYNQYDDIYISPKEQKEFLDMLMQINPGIEII